MLDIGVKALENFQQFESPQANHANPPIEALPLLSKIAQNCYMSAADSESLMKRLPKSVYVVVCKKLVSGLIGHIHQLR
jgi:hypothetical protein